MYPADPGPQDESKREKRSGSGQGQHHQSTRTVATAVSGLKDDNGEYRQRQRYCYRGDAHQLGRAWPFLARQKEVDRDAGEEAANTEELQHGARIIGVPVSALVISVIYVTTRRRKARLERPLIDA